MRRIKSFLAGTLFGCFLVTGVAFASEHSELLTFIDAAFLLDGVTVDAPGETGESDSLVEINGEMYWSLDHAAQILGLDWEWNRERATMKLITRRPVPFEPMTTVPESLRVWIEQSLNKELGQSRVIDGSTYLLITRGEKRTGGYEVEVQAAEQAGDQLIVTVVYTDPDKGDIVTESVTHPFELVKVQGVYEHVEFVLADGTKLPQIEGLSAIPSLAAEADGIMVFAAENREGRLHVRGAVHAFAGTVWLEWREADGAARNVTVTSSASAPDWGRFELDLERVSEEGRLRISSLNPEGDSWREVQISYPQLAAVPVMENE
jgi:hypothetical protein